MKATVLAAGVLALMLAVPAKAETPMQRGRYLVETIAACGNCHTPKDKRGQPVAAKRMAGGFVFKEEPFDAVASNITPDRETGIGKWTLAQTIRAIREGIRPDGSVIGPPMPIELYRGLSDGDVRAIALYIRSAKPVRNKVAKSVYRIPLPKSYGPAVQSVAEPSQKDRVAYGRYLAGPVGHCIECHTPLAKGRRDWSKTGVGGQPFPGPWGVSPARNITPHPTDGIGNWTDAQIVRAIARGISKDGSRLTPPMAFAWYAKAKRSDVLAIVAYLRSLKPLPTK
ncbi:MAG TPA: c-type cytochrome [Alphaproteobacteria bacterium]|nr:c-type cytochrome [Alphaproteobacteria bacterium]